MNTVPFESGAASAAPQRRRGGRLAKQASRSAETALSLGAIRAGLPGGAYKPLSLQDIEAIHATALEILETIGFAQAIPTGAEAMIRAGAVMGEDGRIRFPRALVEDTIARANRDFTLFGKIPDADIHPRGTNVHFATAGAAVHMVDLETRSYRESTLRDLYDAVRLADALDNIHLIQRPLVARDIADTVDFDVNTAYVGLVGTRKHYGTSFSNAESVPKTLELAHMVAGGEEAWRARPFLSMSCCFVVPPLKFAEDACAAMEAAIHGGMPILLLSAGQAGATAPAPLAGAVAQAVAEVLGGLVYVNAVRPGHPAIFGPWPFVSDLRSGAMSGGSGEQGLLSAACAQMGQFYRLPCGSAAGMTDAKLPDMQAGYERGMTAVMAGAAGLNIVYEAAGMYASLLGFSLDSMIIDNDCLGAAMRVVRGIEVNEDTLSLDTIRSVCLDGPGHYLGHTQTLAVMQTEYLYPEIGDRTSPKEWEERGRPDLLEQAIARRKAILESHYPAHVTPDLDARLRAAANILLPRS